MKENGGTNIHWTENPKSSIVGLGNISTKTNYHLPLENLLHSQFQTATKLPSANCKQGAFPLFKSMIPNFKIVCLTEFQQDMNKNTRYKEIVKIYYQIRNW